MGKGSSQRPTDKAAFDSGYERIFGQQAKSEAALQAIVDFSQEHGLYEDMPIENDRIGALFMEAYEKDLFIRMGGKLRAGQQSMGTDDGKNWHPVDPRPGVYAIKASPEFTGTINLPNQTCGNCKHWESYQGDPPICKNTKVTSLLSSCVHNGGTEYLEPPADFGCNRWEAKV